jgi:hypothetical protein
MEIEEIRALIQQGAFTVTDHALTEGFKDGTSVADMVRAVMTGRIIERYPKRQRCLVFGRAASGLPIHVVVEFWSEQAVDFVTTYIPKRSQWIKGQVRKRRKR